MAKDTFYFSHDYNARNDDKIKSLIRKYGLLGYGTFWAIVEDLYNNANALRTDYEGIAFDLRVDVNMVKSIINDFDLFLIDGKEFGSRSIENRLNERNDKSKKARLSALCRWNKLKSDANALQPQSEGNAIKESKGKEIKKVKDSIEDRQQIFKDEIFNLSNLFPNTELLNEFYNYWSELSQKTKTPKMKKETMDSWETSKRLSTWFRNAKKFNTPQTNTSQYPPLMTKNEQRFNKFQEASDGAAAIIRAKYGIKEDS